MTPYLHEVLTVLSHAMNLLGWWGLLSVGIGIPIGFAIGSISGGSNGDE